MAAIYAPTMSQSAGEKVKVAIGRGRRERTDSWGNIRRKCEVQATRAYKKRLTECGRANVADRGNSLCAFDVKMERDEKTDIAAGVLCKIGQNVVRIETSRAE